MTTIKINDTYRVEFHNYNFVLIKRNDKCDTTLGYFPSLKHTLAWLKREEIKSLGMLTIDEYINELRKLESWTGDVLNARNH